MYALNCLHRVCSCRGYVQRLLAIRIVRAAELASGPLVKAPAPRGIRGYKSHREDMKRIKGGSEAMVTRSLSLGVPWSQDEVSRAAEVRMSQEK